MGILTQTVSVSMRKLWLSIVFLSSTHVAKRYPDFGDGSDYWACDGDYCIDKDIYIYVYEEIHIPNRNITFHDGYPEGYDINSESLLKECAPNLSIRNIATMIKSCKDIVKKYKDLCVFSKKGWLIEDGSISRETLQNQLQEIEGMSKYIDICMNWDGESDYEDYYGNYDYWYLEEPDDVSKRSRRSAEPSSEKSEVIKITKRESEKPQRQRNKRRKGKNRKRSFAKKRAGRNKRMKTKKWRKSSKNRNKGNRNGNRKAAKRNNRRKKGNQRKGKGKKNKNKKKKKGKNKKKEEKKILRTIGVKSFPTDLDLKKLKCMEKAVNYGLRKCAEKIFRQYAEEK